jgi:hypothetical protein
MDIVLEYPKPLKEGSVGQFAEEAGLTRKSTPKYFKGQIFTQPADCGDIRVAVPEHRNRIVISTGYQLAHMRSFQLLILARIAARMGENPKLTFSQEFTHMDLNHFFPEGKRVKNQIQM